MIYLILLISFLLRFWKVSEWTYFGLDQEYAAYLMQRIVSGVNFPLIGVNASDTGLYLGPFFLYFGSLWQFLGGGNPVWGSVVASVLGILNTWFIYFVGRQIFNKKIGLFASLIWALSFPLIIWDRKFWNPMWIPILSLLILLSLYKIEKGKSKFIYLIAFAIGLGISSHLQIFIFGPLIFYAIFKNWQAIKFYILKSFVFLLLFISPLILFDLSHSLTISKSLFQSSSGSQVNIYSNYQNLVLGLTRFLGVWGKPELTLENSPVAGDLTNKVPVSPLSWILLSGSTILFIKFRNKNNLNRYFLILGLTTLLLPLFYWKPLSDYYLLYFAPWLILIVAWVLNEISNSSKFVPGILIAVFTVSQLVTFFSSSMDYSYTDKIKAVKFVGNLVETKMFNLNASENRFRFGGYRYLFSYNGVVPARSYIDENLGWLYKNDPEFVGDVVYLYPVNEYIQENLPANPDMTAQFGKIGVAIYKNEN